MPINKQRFREYARQMQALQARVGKITFTRIFMRKLRDLLASGMVSKEELKGIESVLRQLFGESFTGFKERLFASYDDIIGIVNDNYDDIGTDMRRQMHRMQAIEQVSHLQLDSYSASTREAIVAKVEEGLKNDLSVAEITESLRGVMGKARRYAKTLAFTQVKRYGRAAKYEKALLAGVEYFFYAGVLRETTRPFCRACLHKIYHITTILRMRNGNLEPVILNCGGWNCIHDWEPDPTATKEDAETGSFWEITDGKKTINLFGGKDVKQSYQWSKGLEPLVNRGVLRDYIEKARQIELTSKRIQHIKNRHPDLYADWSDKQLAERVNEIRQNPDRIYYQYQPGREGARYAFVKDEQVVFATRGEVKTMYRPDGWRQFAEAVLTRLINLNDLL